MRPFQMAHMFRESVTFEPFDKVDASGEPTYGAEEAFKARIVMKNRNVIAPDGREVISNTTVYVMAKPLFDVRSRITLPATFGLGSSDDRTPPIIDFQSFPDQRGHGYTEVML